MSRIKFTGMWSTAWQKEFNIPKGFIVLKPTEIYRKPLGQTLKKLDKIQTEKNELKELDIEIDIHYKKRTLDQNALMWSLYEIEANEMNGGQSGCKDHVVTSEELYNQDLIDYAPRLDLLVGQEEYDYIRSVYRMVDVEKIDEKTGKRYLKIILTSSTFNTVQFAKWIERIFNRLAIAGVTNSNHIGDYWVKFRQHLNSEKIILNNDDSITQEVYRKLNPVCEACGQMASDLAHINAKGMGGNYEAIDHSWNWLMLCHEDHIAVQHQKGWNEFLKKYPHLKNKVEIALLKTF